ncbi:MAG: hypothetical protein DRJ56_04055 [Thermoprotei archaeon]|nr:MAG: hypothetical protein DRJ56_04055 [Thermoprotei archaeon]
MRMPEEDVSEIVRLIAEKKSLSEDEVRELVRRRVEEFEGLITEYAAALMVAKELGVQVSGSKRSLASPLRIRDLVKGLRNVTVCARVVAVSPPRRYSRKGRDVVVVKLLLSDGTGVVPLALWGDQAKMAEGLRPGALVRVRRAVVREFRGRLELSLASGGSVRVVDEAEASVPPLEEVMPDELKGGEVTVVVDRVMRGAAFSRVAGERRAVVCVRGRDAGNGSLVRVIAWGGLTSALEGIAPGATVRFMGLKPSSESGDYVLGEWTTVEVLKRGGASEGRALLPSSVRAAERLRGLDVEGLVGYVEPRGAYSASVLLHDDASGVLLRLPISLIGDLLKREPPGGFTDVDAGSACQMRVYDADVQGEDGLLILRANPWSEVEVSDVELSAECPRVLLLREARGFFSARLTITDLELRVAVYDDGDGRFRRQPVEGRGRPLAVLRLTLEDGLSRVRGLTNDWGVVERLLGVGYEDALELLESSKLLSEVVDYARGEVRGSEWVVYGCLLRPQAGSEVAVVFKVEPINPEYEIRLVEERLRELGEGGLVGEEEARAQEEGLQAQEEDT